MTTVFEKTEEFKENHKEALDKLNEKKELYAAKKIEKRAEIQREYQELTKKYKELLEQKNFGFKRLLKAFPDMISRDQNEMLQKYKDYFNIRKKHDKKDKGRP